MIQTIYTPSGRAREYSPRALNYYDGCDHGCKYCYVPKMKGRWGKDWNQETALPREGILEAVAKKLASDTSKDQVFLSFAGDPYCRAEEVFGLTRRLLHLFLAHRVPVSILSKGGARILRDVHLFEEFGPNIKVGQTLTFLGTRSAQVEPGAANPGERLRILRPLKKLGIRTWVSLEPVIDPAESLDLLRKALPYIDEVKIGTLNHAKKNVVDYEAFLVAALKILSERPEVDVYVKKDLRDACPRVMEAGIVHGKLVDQDYSNLTWRKK